MQHKHVGSYLAHLPMELHLNIRHKLITDPKMTIRGFKRLRLVCKLFDTIWSPIVMANMTLFNFNIDPTRHVNHLYDIVRDKGTTAAFTTTLTLRRWECLDINWTFRKVRYSWRNNGYVNPGQISIKFTRYASWLLIRPLMGLQDIPGSFKKILNCIQARCYASLLPHKLQLPNLRCIRSSFPRSESKWATYRLTRMLSAFPQLAELELTITTQTNMAYVTQCLRHFRALRKLTLVILYVLNPRRRKDLPHPEINYLSRLIANNRNLTHLTLIAHTNRLVDLSEFFLNVPFNRPLVLEHVSCDDNCQNFEALLPHIQSLSSFEFRCHHRAAVNTWCITLSDAGIFSPIIKAHRLDPQLIMYLKKHPAIVQLSLLDWEEDRSISAIESDELCYILAQNSATLQYLEIPSRKLTKKLRKSRNRVNLKQCNKLFSTEDSAVLAAFYR